MLDPITGVRVLAVMVAVRSQESGVSSLHELIKKIPQHNKRKNNLGFII
jgi:hypothetical protein